MKNKKDIDATGRTLTDLTPLLTSCVKHEASDACAGNETDPDKSIPEARIDGLTIVVDVAVKLVVTTTGHPGNPIKPVYLVDAADANIGEGGTATDLAGLDNEELVADDGLVKTLTDEPESLACVHNRPKCVGTNITVDPSDKITDDPGKACNPGKKLTDETEEKSNNYLGGP